MEERNDKANAEAKPAKQHRLSKKQQKAIEYTVWCVLLLIVLTVAGGVYIIADSAKAISAYRDGIFNQYSDATNGKNVGAPIELRKVWLADKINPRYQKTLALNDSYKKLLSDIKSYNQTREAHDKLVKIFNEGTEGTTTLSSKTLDAVQSYEKVIKSYYPNESTRLQAMSELESKVASSINFSEISQSLNRVLHDNDEWLDTVRNNINSEQDTFQQKINSI